MSAERVCEAVHALMSNAEARATANEWLTQFQQSMEAWEVCNEILGTDCATEYLEFAATTLKKKIEAYIHEVPEENRMALRDSLGHHIGNHRGNTKVVGMLAVCLAEMAVLVDAWESPIADMMELLTDRGGYVALLQFLEALPIEARNYRMRIPPSRKQHLRQALGEQSAHVYPFLEHCFDVKDDASDVLHRKSFQCLAAWLEFGGTGAANFAHSPLLNIMFHGLSHSEVQDQASDAIVSAVYLSVARGQEELRGKLIPMIFELRPPFEAAIVNNDINVGQAIGQIFAELVDSSIKDVLHRQDATTGQIIDLNLLGASFPDFKIARMQFPFWQEIAGELDEKYASNVKAQNIHETEFFRPYYLRLMEHLSALCRCEEDEPGLLDKDTDLYDFRDRLVRMMEETVWLTGDSGCIGNQLLQHIGSNSGSWNVVEADMFLMRNIVLTNDDGGVLVNLLPFICQFDDTSHVMLRYTAVQVIAKFASWIGNHQEYLDHVFQFCFNHLRCPELRAVIVNAVADLCVHARSNMHAHYEQLIQLVTEHESLALTQESVLIIYKGIGRVIASMNGEDISVQFNALMLPLVELLHAANSGADVKQSQLVDILDRIGELCRSTNVPNATIRASGGHPCKDAIVSTWEIFQGLLQRYGESTHVVEHINRCVKFMLRNLREHGIPMVESVVETTLAVYNAYYHSSCLYVGYILVTLFGESPEYASWLLDMIQTFSASTFQVLTATADSLNDHPDIVEDFFRLNSEMLLVQPEEFVKRGEFLLSCTECAVASLHINQQEANETVTVFLANLASIQRSVKVQNHEAVAGQLLELFGHRGEQIVHMLVDAACGVLPPHFMVNISDALYCILKLDKDTSMQWVCSAPKLQELPNQFVTKEDRDNFVQDLASSKECADVSDALKYMSRLYDR